MVSHGATETQRTSYRQRIFNRRGRKGTQRLKSFKTKKLEFLLCELRVSVVNPCYGFTKKPRHNAVFLLLYHMQLSGTGLSKGFLRNRMDVLLFS